MDNNRKLKKIKTRQIRLREDAERDGDDGLLESVRRNGVLTPILVRRTRRGYEVVAGARRYRAAQSAGLNEIPALIVAASDAEASILSLCENMHRRELCCFDAAQTIQKILDTGMTQKELAARLSLSQGAVANKLRLLSFEEDQRRFARENALSERHLRAVLRLPEDKRDAAMGEIARRGLSAAAAELYVSRALENDGVSERRHPIVRDVRLFFNTITRAVETMNRSGLGAVAVRRDTPKYIEYIIKIPAEHEREKAQ